MPDPSSAPRKLHRGHFAFMRAVVQGLDIAGSWQRYLQVEGEHRDARVVRKTIAWMRNEFAAAARRHQRHGAARLIALDLSNAAASPAAPSLDDFIVANGLEGFSEAEQLDAFQQEFGRRSNTQARRARLIARQLDALHWLEELEAEPPAAGDPVSSWFHPLLAQRLQQDGLSTLAQLAARINGLGRNWFRTVPAIGAGKAERIVDWMREHQDALGIPIGAHVAHPRRALSPALLAQVVPLTTVAVVPLDKLFLPPELDGSRGANRGTEQQCRLAADNDMEAILAWLDARDGNSGTTAADGVAATMRPLSHTRRAYWKEAERFLLWAVVERGKPMSSLNTDDCRDYLAFLANPAPAERWCGPRSRQRWSPLWRPFEGPVSPAGRRHAFKILRNMCGYLQEQGYLRRNCWEQVVSPAGDTGDQPTLDLEQWRAIEACLASLPPTSSALRLQVTLKLLRATGLHLSKAVRLRLDDVSSLPAPPFGPNHQHGEEWDIRLPGAPAKQRTTRIPASLVSEITRYLVSRGLAPDPKDPRNQGAYLLGRTTDVAVRAPWTRAAKNPVDPKAGVSATTLSKEIRAFFSKCATQMERVDSIFATQLATASLHWLR